MASHSAVVTLRPRARLQVVQVPTVTPGPGEVRVRVQWTCSTPFDMHQAEGGFGVKSHPEVLGDGLGGTVVEVGSGVDRLTVGDEVFGFTWRSNREKPQQEFATLPAFLLGKLPAGTSLQEAVTLPDPLVTVFHAVTTDLGIVLPWPVPKDYRPEHADVPILIWGGAGSVGQYALQVLRHWGYTNLIATASAKHHELLQEMGAAQVVDYRAPDVVEKVLQVAGKDGKREGPVVPLILDCIGLKESTLAPIARIAQKGSKVAVLLPVIIRDATDDVEPVYSFETSKEASWADGVEVRGVRTHFYLENEYHKEHLQSEIMPTLLAEGVVKPTAQRVVEGATMLDRAQKAIDMLRRREVSGERLVWRVAD